MVLQAVCRDDLLFVDVYTGWPGKVHDAKVFRNSPLFEKGPDICLNNGHLLGDSAYPNLQWILTPFRDNGHLTPAQNKFNKCHSAIRSTIERAFSLYKARFPRFRYLDQQNIQSIVETILCGCVIHNICILNNDEIEAILLDDDVPQPLPCAGNFPNDSQQRGALKRLSITRELRGQH